PEVVGPVAERLTPHAAGAIFGHVELPRLQELLQRMAPRDAAAVLLHLDESRRDAALMSLPEDAARGLRTLVAYPPETAGGIMDPQVVSLAVDLTVREAVDLMRRAPRQSLYYLYVTDRAGVLHGVLSLRDLLLTGASEPIRPLVNP